MLVYQWKENKMISPTEVADRLMGRLEIDKHGNKRWYLNGEYHREDGSAVEYVDGGKEWWINGNLHREDGPAVEWADGRKEWCVNGNLHREDGPAVEYANGKKEWWVNGEQIGEQIPEPSKKPDSKNVLT